jgi:beta-glucuronidase
MNFKGVFTRDRKPKMAAHYLRSRWFEGDKKQKTGSTTALKASLQD